MYTAINYYLHSLTPPFLPPSSHHHTLTSTQGFKENLLPYKPRPVLTPTLFEQPKDTVGMPPATKKLKESK